MLEELKDNVKDLELEARRPNLEDSPLTRKIRMLENRLDKLKTENELAELETWHLYKRGTPAQPQVHSRRS